MVPITYAAHSIFKARSTHSVAQHSTAPKRTKGKMPPLWFVRLFFGVFLFAFYIFCTHTQNTHANTQTISRIQTKSIHSEYWTKANTINHSSMSSVHWVLFDALDTFNGNHIFLAPVFLSVWHQMDFLFDTIDYVKAGERTRANTQSYVCHTFWITK